MMTKEVDRKVSEEKSIWFNCWGIAANTRMPLWLTSNVVLIDDIIQSMLSLTTIFCQFN